MSTGPPTPRDRIGPYELVRPLGVGGMGEVWEAVLHGPAGFRKPVALKRLRGERPGERRHLDALLREARLGARLQHPNIVATLGLSSHEGTWVVALELVRGATVWELVKACPTLSARAILEIGIQAATGLAHAHDAGLVHRDIKPANLIVDRTGLVKIVDLGISLSAGEGVSRAGSPPYMAPEQSVGHAVPASDLFSLGVTLFACATGLLPFGRAKRSPLANRGLDSKVTSETFLARLDAVVPGLGGVVSRCLRTAPEDRWPDARALRGALAALRSQLPAGQPGLVDLLAQARPELCVERTSPASSADPTQRIARGNVIEPRDGFVGRGAELEALRRLVLGGGHRLVVLLGPGGMGKTRLSLELARSIGSELRGGSWAFDLTDARTEEGLCAAVARGLGLELGRSDPVGQLGVALAAKGRALLMFDNLEQCVAHLPATLGRWVDLAPDATFLGTSRAVLRLRGEHTVDVGPLAAPDASELFVLRAARPLTDDERAQVEDLCEALEHMPLAIELAAARVRVLGVGRILEHLSLPLLRGPHPDLPARHRSLEASLDWSVELLSPDARAAFVTLAVFEGGFDLDAAIAVLDLDGAIETLGVLEELVEASLLRLDPRTGRCSMLALVREYGAARMAETRAATEVRHGAHFAQLGSAAHLQTLDGPAGGRCLHAMWRDLDNLVVACRRATARGDGAVAVATLCAVWKVLGLQGPFPLGSELAVAVLAMGGLHPRQEALAERVAGWAVERTGSTDEARPHLERAAALFADLGDRHEWSRTLAGTATLLIGRGRLEEALGVLGDALDLAREAGSKELEGAVLGSLGRCCRELGRRDEAMAHLVRALEILQESGSVRTRGTVLGFLANLEFDLGRLDDAGAHYEQVRALQQDLGGRLREGVLISNVGLTKYARGDLGGARAQWEESLALHRELGARRFVGIDLGHMAMVDMAQGHGDRAVERYRAALRVYEEVGDRLQEGIVLGNLGNTLAQLGQVDEAREAFEGSLVVHREVGSPSGIARVVTSLACLDMQVGLVDAAAERFATALQLSRDIGDRRNRAVVLQGLGDVHDRRGEPDQAAEYLEAAIDILRGLGERRNEAAALARLAVLRARAGANDEASELIGRGEELIRESGDPAKLAMVLGARAEICWLDGDAEHARTALAEAEAVAPQGRPETLENLARIRSLLAGSRR